MTELEKHGIPNSERTKCEVWTRVMATIAQSIHLISGNREKWPSANILTRRSAAVANKFDLSAFTQQQKISVKSLKNFRFTSI